MKIKSRMYPTKRVIVSVTVNVDLPLELYPTNRVMLSKNRQILCKQMLKHSYVSRIILAMLSFLVGIGVVSSAPLMSLSLRL